MINDVSKTIVNCLEKSGADDILLINLDDNIDNIILASGTSKKRVQFLAEDLILNLKKKFKIVIHVEGLSVAEWVLIEIYNTMVHIFVPDIRKYYDLDNFWIPKAKNVLKSPIC